MKIGVAPLKFQNQLHSDSQSKVGVLLEQFSSVFTREQPSTPPPMTGNVKDPISNIIISESRIKKLLSDIRVSKAAGPDSIPNKILCDCVPSLSLIFQKSLDTGCLPTDWPNANVAPIFREGDRHLPENYRPVSLTSVISKVLEHIVCKRFSIGVFL